MFSKHLVALILCVLPVLAAPSPLVTVAKTKNPVPGRYIVTFKNDVVRADGVSSVTSAISSQSKVTKQWDIINGFAGAFTDADLEVVRSNPNVASIEEDAFIHVQAITTQKDAPWGLGRVSSKTKLANQDVDALTYTYTYDSTAGANSDVYIIDTGIFTSHPAFGGRASWGAVFGGGTETDTYGHGTHTAGTAVSGPFGVAKAAKVIAVKVFDDGGTGSWETVISGMDWVAGAAKRSGRPSVASLSLGGTFSAAVNDAAAKLVSSGVTTVAAAGNDHTDGFDFSPACTPSVIAVGATTIADARAEFSNFGAVIDIWAPGDDIISTWNDGKTYSTGGTSMAAPHVAGYAAYLLTLDSSLTPAAVDSAIKSKALKNVLRDIPAGTTNALLNNGL